MSVERTHVSVREESVKTYQERFPVTVQKASLCTQNQESVKVLSYRRDSKNFFITMRMKICDLCVNSLLSRASYHVLY